MKTKIHTDAEGRLPCENTGRDNSDINMTKKHLVLPRVRGFPGGASDKEPDCQCRRHERHEFNPWVRKIWRRAWQPTPGFLSGEFHGQRSLQGYSP